MNNWTDPFCLPLELQKEADPKKRDALQKQCVKGWAIAGEVYKKKLHCEFKKMDAAKDWGGRELQELNEMSNEELVAHLLNKHRKRQEHIDQDKKSAGWKIALAWELRKQTSSTNPWIAQRLNIGDPSNVSRHVNKIPNIKGLTLFAFPGRNLLKFTGWVIRPGRDLNRIYSFR